jgi:hypothetical protein
VLPLVGGRLPWIPLESKLDYTYRPGHWRTRVQEPGSGGHSTVTASVSWW